MAAINFSGIASGIDTNSLIDATLEQKRATRITPLETKVSELNDTTTTLTSLQTKLKALQSKLLSFSSLSTGAVSKTGVSSDETVVTASATSGTSNSTYNLTVTQLATNGRMTIPAVGGYATGATALGITVDGNAVFNVGGSAISVAVTTTTTASQFIESFNTAAGSAATAVLVNVGTTAIPSYKVLISTTQTGATEGAISLTSQPGPGDITEAHTPVSQDAIVSISGIGTSIQRSSNTITDIIPGVTFNLKGAGTSSVSIVNDSAATLTDVKEFVKLYNDIVTTVNDNNTIVRDESNSESTNVFGTLAKTSTDDAVLASLRTALASISYSITDSGGQPTNNIVNFSAMGIITDASAYDAEAKTGGATLTFVDGKTDTFLAALASEPDSVNELLTRFADLVALTQDGSDLINDYVKVGGILEISINSNNDQVRSANMRIADLERLLANEEASLRQRYAAFESLTGRLQQQQQSLISSLGL